MRLVAKEYYNWNVLPLFTRSCIKLPAKAFNECDVSSKNIRPAVFNLSVV
jgi:hypothetical protein